MKIAIGSDHGGFELKEYLKQMLAAVHELTDVGTNGLESVDYPDYAIKVARLVAGGQVERGILICSTGIGMSVTANKVRGVRAALAFDLFAAACRAGATSMPISLCWAPRSPDGGLRRRLSRYGWRRLSKAAAIRGGSIK